MLDSKYIFVMCRKQQLKILFSVVFVSYKKKIHLELHVTSKMPPKFLSHLIALKLSKTNNILSTTLKVQVS